MPKENKRTKNLIKELLSKRTEISSLVEEYDMYKKYIDAVSLNNGIIFPCYIWKNENMAHIINTCDGVGKNIPKECAYISDLKELDKYLGLVE